MIPLKCQANHTLLLLKAPWSFSTIRIKFRSLHTAQASFVTHPLLPHACLSPGVQRSLVAPNRWAPQSLPLPPVTSLFSGAFPRMAFQNWVACCLSLESYCLWNSVVRKLSELDAWPIRGTYICPKLVRQHKKSHLPLPLSSYSLRFCDEPMHVKLVEALWAEPQINLLMRTGNQVTRKQIGRGSYLKCRLSLWNG